MKYCNNILKGSSRYFLFGVLIIFCSCSSPIDKANQFILDLPENTKIHYKDISENNSTLLTYNIENDTTGVLSYHDFNNEVTYILFKANPKTFDICEAFPNGNEIIVITREKVENKEYYYLYSVYILRNYKDSKSKTMQRLFVNNDSKDLGANSYVIDKDAKLIILGSYSTSDEAATFYHTVYDFNGNQIVNDPYTWRPIVEEMVREAVYLWECQYCREKRSATKEPSIFEFTCHGRGERPGFGNSHKWVKVARIE